MALFLLLIILLAVAWGLADYQLQSRIEQAPPPAPVTRPAPVVPPQTNVAPPAQETTASAGNTSETDRSTTAQDAQSSVQPPTAERSEQKDDAR